jgi:hypothetical protein
MKTSRLIPSAIALTVLAAAAPGLALADAAMAEATAAQHATLAASGADLHAVQMHLHHVLNCLVGPDGDGFDASAGNPCQAAGGAIPQTTDADMKKHLTEIAMHVHDAIMSTDVDAAKKTAMDVAGMLKKD